MKGQWKAIPGYEGFYEVSDKGAVRSLDRIVTHRDGGYQPIRGRLLRATLTNGYLQVYLSKSGKTKGIKVHRLVAISFLPNPNAHPQVNHKNGIKTDNRSLNLEWCDLAHNMRHAVENNLKWGVKVMDLITGTIHNSISQAQKDSGYKYQTLCKMLRGDMVNKTKLRLVDEQCEEMIQAGLYVLEIDVNEEGKRFDDSGRAWAAFKECMTSCALTHRDEGMIAEKWLEDDDEGTIHLEEMIYDEQFETIEIYA